MEWRATIAAAARMRARPPVQGRLPTTFLVNHSRVRPLLSSWHGHPGHMEGIWLIISGVRYWHVLSWNC